VDRAEALDLLPTVYAVALRLDESGVAPAVIAEGVGITPEAVPAFLEVARGKLARLLQGEST
jgi:predicted transcriptional regulator